MLSGDYGTVTVKNRGMIFVFIVSQNPGYSSVFCNALLTAVVNVGKR